MKHPTLAHAGIPIAPSLDSTLADDGVQPRVAPNKQRLVRISALAVLVALTISLVARLLVYLINLVTNLVFHGELALNYHSPATNHLGLWVILMPALGGLLVSLMAIYGSKAIRGHGIPEAMEQILTNQSRIKPSIMYLKPLSAAISIGTGGPFGAEGPIIATGGALGSTLGQLINITHHERKVLLAAGATAGMSAIFGTPIAAVFLAIELLLFEFSPRSLLPVALACITGAAGHHLLFEQGPVFEMPALLAPSNGALATYSAIGLLVGLASVVITKIVYFIEDSFEKLPIHWAWWPALGGLAVGGIGYFAPRTLGVGYENITTVLSGNAPLSLLLSLCLLKFASWAISLGSGTSGGTLAPLLTIGGATGALLGVAIKHFFPASDIVLPLAALVGMAAMFAGASRALLTSIVFAVESTGQAQALLPLLGACTGAYLVSFLLMGNTIMTEKIARRGVKTPVDYEPDLLDKVNVGRVLQNGMVAISTDNSIREVREWTERDSERTGPHLVIVNPDGSFAGIVSTVALAGWHADEHAPISALLQPRSSTVLATDTLRTAVERMARENVDVLPVLSPGSKALVSGVISYRDILTAYKNRLEDDGKMAPHISLKRKSLRVLLRGQALFQKQKSEIE
ncbi:chloride channel protein [Hymenobacter sp. BT770]|uniref:chloride channel protein n=1 Tax=Hymenobacter sp. BT770 TaxID=2886942 RepID=UPI001D0FE40C|nr:chloride channel protein [Hymenobacter sp. BT770]MCC3153954.1 chloride channel protein [Hymenobacter sp. BT770]MDO3416116.1 chloride channel protein [Hymenobacter sp. BT770]